VLFISKKIRKTEPLQVIAEGFKIEEILDPNFFKKLKEAYSDEFRIRTVRLDILLLEKAEEASKIKVSPEAIKEGKVEVSVKSVPINTLTLRHRGEEEYTNEKVVVEASDGKILDKFLKIFK